LGDVMAIEQSGPATSRWTIQGPLCIRIKWTIKVTEERTNELIRYETVTSPGLRTYWEVHFVPGSEAGQTEVREVMKAPLKVPCAPLFAKSPNLYCADGPEPSLPSTTAHLAGSISASEMNHVFLSL